MLLKCNGCGYAWHYQGRGRDRTTCPTCFKTVYFTTGRVDAEVYRSNALAQLKRWFENEVKHINEVADAEVAGTRQPASTSQ